MRYEELPGLRGNESETQALLRTSLRQQLDHAAPVDLAMAALGTPAFFAEGLWESLVKAGWTASLFPAEIGGQDLSLGELAPAISEIGAHLLPGPFFSSAVVVPVLAGHDAAFSEAFTDVAAGRKRVAIALWERPIRGFSHEAKTTITADRISGIKHLVPDASLADLLLVRSRGPQGATGYALVETAGPGVIINPLASLAGRNLCHVTLEDAPVLAASHPPEGGTAAMDESLRRYSLLVALLQFGGSHAALSLATVYSRERVQFGRPIGSFQAVSHRLADMYCNVAVAGAVALQAANSAGSRTFARGATMAKLLGNRTYSDVAAGALQIFGGVGYTFEHPIHLYLRAAKVLAGSGGTSEECERSLQEDFREDADGQEGLI